jgi:hypothetical protein
VNITDILDKTCPDLLNVRGLRELYGALRHTQFGLDLNLALL